MKKIILMLCLGLITIWSDEITIELNKDAKFSDGFGLIEARPILKDVKEDIKLLGDFNLEKNNNVEIIINKLSIDNNVYKLTEPFIKKARLKNPSNAKIKKGDKIKISGGSQTEILNYLNSNSNKPVTQISNQAKNLTNDALDSISSKYDSYGSNNASQSPYYYPNTITGSNLSNTTKDLTSSTDANGKCKSPTIENGVVNVYSSVGGSCTLFTASEDAIYTKNGRPTCQNIVDYKNNTIRIGKEGYITMEDNKEYLVRPCSYSDNIQLSSEIGNCKAIPNFEEKTALLQKQFYYIENNNRVDVGSCTPTDEQVTLLTNVNDKCQYSYDFLTNKATKQAQYYYIKDNQTYNVGGCVDMVGDKFVYPMYEDTAGCSFTSTPEGVKLYQTRLAFNGLTNAKEYATDCRIINTQGLEVFEEFASYSLKDDSKQAIRKINQYFIGVGNRKIYLTKDVETNKAYPYKERACGWEHNDDELYSQQKMGLYFEDTDEKKEIDLKKCDDKENIDYIKIGYIPLKTTSNIETLKNQEVIPDISTNRWKIKNTDIFLENNPQKIATNIYELCHDDGNGGCHSKEKLHYHIRIDLKNTCPTYSHNIHSGYMDNPFGFYYLCRYNNDVTLQTIEKENLFIRYLRGDSSYYDKDTEEAKYTIRSL